MLGQRKCYHNEWTSMTWETELLAHFGLWTKEISVEYGYYLRLAIHSGEVLSEVEGEVTDGDHYVTDRGVSTSHLPLHVHGELLVRPTAVWGQVVFTQTRELVHITIEGLEVLSAPCAADAVDMVENCGSNIRGICEWCSQHLLIQPAPQALFKC